MTRSDLGHRQLRQWRGRVCVYYIRRGNRIKIGWTARLDARMRELAPCTVLAVEPVPDGYTGRQWETKRHDQFWRERIRGESEREWFRPSVELERHIVQIAKRYPVPTVAVFSRPRRRTMARVAVPPRVTVPPEHVTERTGPVGPLPLDAIPLKPRYVHPLDADQEVPARLRRLGMKRFPAYDAPWMPTVDKGQMADHWPLTVVYFAIFTAVLYDGIGIYAVPLGLATMIVSFIIVSRLTTRAANRRRAREARRRGQPHE